MLYAGVELEFNKRLNNLPLPSLVVKPGKDWLSINAGMTILDNLFFVSNIHV